MSYYELPFWRQFLLTCEDNLMGELILLIYLLPFFKEGSIRQHLKKFPLLLLIAPTVAVVNWSAVSVITNAPLMSLLSALSVLAFTLWTMWVWHCSFWQSLSIVCIAGMLQSSFSVILLYLVKAALPLTELESFHPEIFLLIICLTLPVHAVRTPVAERTIPCFSGRFQQCPPDRPAAGSADTGFRNTGSHAIRFRATVSDRIPAGNGSDDCSGDRAGVPSDTTGSGSEKVADPAGYDRPATAL